MHVTESLLLEPWFQRAQSSGVKDIYLVVGTVPSTLGISSNPKCLFNINSFSFPSALPFHPRSLDLIILGDPREAESHRTSLYVTDSHHLAK